MTTPHIPQNWRKSSHSGQDTDCVEVGRLPGGAAVRDTKNRQAGHITATNKQWTTFLTALKHDTFNR